MKKKQFGVILLAALLLSSSLPMAASAYSLIVAPARFSVLQVLFDVIDKRSAVLVSYQGEAGTDNPALHVWSGAAWNPLGLHELQELSFLQSTPERVIMIGDDALLPLAVRDRLVWMPEVVFVRELGNASLINELGRVLKWSSYEWRWFAGRYKLDLEDLATPKRNASWYDQPGPLKKPEATGNPGGVYEEPAPAPLTTYTPTQSIDEKSAPAPSLFEQQPASMPVVISPQNNSVTPDPEVISIPEPPVLDSGVESGDEVTPEPAIDQSVPVTVDEISATKPSNGAEQNDLEIESTSTPVPAAESVAPAPSEKLPTGDLVSSSQRETPPSRSYTLDDLIKDLQEPTPAPALKEPVPSK
jgi:hypothetical protein